mmetsp:Transcript_16094/g.27182  ORF Transcript_16094/g.27182 Transcript_16094/m.27182 type:complete len:339 (-) Transcript_16094:535-1551(-)
MLYLSILAYTIMLSVGAPLDKTINYFGFVAAFFSFVSIFSIVNAIIASVRSGYMVPDVEWDPKTETWHHSPSGGKHLSVGALVGPFLLSAYAMPLVLRPLDFLQNFKKYTIGIVCYLCMLPVFGSVLQIYAMSNLHDVSWGNRPNNVQQSRHQEQLSNQYKMFRSNFLTFWIISNGLVACWFDYQTNKKTKSLPNVHESVGAQLLITIFGTSFLLYRLIFAIILNIRFKIMHSCIRKYKIKSIQELKKDAVKNGIVLGKSDAPSQQPQAIQNAILRQRESDEQHLLPKYQKEEDQESQPSSKNQKSLRKAELSCIDEYESDCGAAMMGNNDENMVQHG